MKLEHPLILNTAGFTASILGRRWAASMDLQTYLQDPRVDPFSATRQDRYIFVFWHEYIAIPLLMRGRCKISILLSMHRDAEALSYLGYLLGYDLVRGSSTRGGADALRQLKRRSATWNLAITPDGPRGPRRELALGPVYLASRLGLSLVPFGVGFDRPWRFKSWDRFAVPRPFSRGRIVIGPAQQIPAKLDKAGLELARQKAEATLQAVTLEAEAWAASGQYRKDAFVVPQGPSPELVHRHVRGGEQVFRPAPITGQGYEILKRSMRYALKAAARYGKVPTAAAAMPNSMAGNCSAAISKGGARVR